MIVIYKIIVIVIVILCLFTCDIIESFESKLDKIEKIKHNIYGEIYTFGKTDLISNNISDLNSIWEEDICQAMAKYYISGTDMIDLGANLGLNSIRSNQIKQVTGTIHLFEPQSDVFTMMAFNTRNLKNRKLYNMTIGENNQILSFSQDNDNVGGTNILRNQNGNVIVSSISLDEINFDNKVSLVKMDIEGGEEIMLLNSQKFFQTHKPTLFIEIHADKYETVSKLLNSMNYVLIQQIGSHDYIFQHN